MDVKEIKWQVKWWLPTIWFRYFVRPVRRVITVLAYMKQGWNTEDWDYQYLLDDIVFKLNRINNRIRKNDVLDPENVSEISNQVKAITDLIQKHSDDTYFDNIPSVRVETIPVEGKNYAELKFLPPEGISEEERNKLLQEALKEYNKDWDEIWVLMSKYVRNFWD